MAVVGWRRQLDHVPRPRRSLAAGEGGGEVLLLEEETRKVRDHLAEVKGGMRVNLTVEGGGMAAAMARMWQGAAAARSPAWMRGEWGYEWCHVGSSRGEKRRGKNLTGRALAAFRGRGGGGGGW
jgi:hypothetical protein